ncbi:hypothetical protein [Herbaspirillum sp. YR522]|nr:hypothetical protein [Herbaspirillum sp. YR522]EJN03270.1 hypothetical protein PMI40_02819 [Herbaspirillum sp. YR522]
MRTYLTSAVVVAALFATSGAYAAEVVIPQGIDWAMWSDWLREAAGSLPG